MHDSIGETPDDDLAADFVLGLLSPEDHALAEHRVSTDGAFAGIVDRWRRRFADFDATAPELTASHHLWERIEQEVGSPSPSVQSSRPGPFNRFWNSLDALRLAATAAAAIAVLCAGLAMFFRNAARDAGSTKPIYVAILVSDTTRQAGALVNTFADGHAELVPLVDIDVPSGRALQVWTLWDRAVGPRPVALIDRARTTPLNLQSLPSTGTDQLFEITLEPVAGSPIGRPTGPILFKGTTSRAL